MDPARGDARVAGLRRMTARISAYPSARLAMPRRVDAPLLPRDAVARVRDYNAAREAERRALKWRAMRTSPFAYFRGTANVFWEDCAALRRAIPDSPLVWGCGDLHLENFGSYRGDNGLAYFDLNDFDEAARTPLSWELVRFVASLLVAAPQLALTASDGRTLASLFLGSYRAALLDGKARWIERATADGIVRELLRAVKRRSQAELLARRTVVSRGRRRIRIDMRHALAASARARAAVTRWCNHFASTQPDPAFFEVLDVARRIAGTGSLGVERFIILVRGAGPSATNALLDVKEAVPSTLGEALGRVQPVWRSEAERVVTTQHRMQAIAPALLRALPMDGVSVVLRELQPTEDRLALASMGGRPHRLHRVIADMGRLVGWAHLRASGRGGAADADVLGAFARTSGWRRALLGYAHWYRRQVDADYRQFATAYDGGAFR